MIETKGEKAMISIERDVKTVYAARLENLYTEVRGFHLTSEVAAEIGFEKITGLLGVIKEVCRIEEEGDWEVYGLNWATNDTNGFVRVYVQRLCGTSRLSYERLIELMKLVDKLCDSDVLILARSVDDEIDKMLCDIERLMTHVGWYA